MSEQARNDAMALDWKNSAAALQRLLQPELLARLASAINLILLLVVAYSLAQLTWTLIPQVEQIQLISPQGMGRQATKASVPETASGMQDIARWHLFGRADAVAALPKPRQEQVPETTLKLELRGILASDDEGVARAIIAEPSRKENAYSIGSRLPGGASLNEIHVDHIVLSRNGRLETLRLPKERIETATTGSSRRSPRSSSRATAGSSLREVRDTLLREPQNLVGLLQAEPQFENGKIAGYKLGAGQDTRMLRRFGLRRGDIITAVNGITLDGPTKLPELLRTLPTAEEVKIEYKRRGRPRSIVLNMNE